MVLNIYCIKNIILSTVLGERRKAKGETANNHSYDYWLFV